MAGHTPEKRASGYSALLRRLESDGVGEVSLTSPGALLGLGPAGVVTTDCGRCSEGGLPLRWRVKAATHRFVTADTFEMMGIRVLQGRVITDQDAWGAPRVAVVNRSLAAREFQDGQAIGRRIRVVDDGEQWSTVVGVVDDPPPAGLGASLQPGYSVYLSVLQHPPASVELLTRGGGPPGGGTSLGRLRAAQAAPLRWFADRFSAQGWAMLGIAVVGSLAVARLWVTSLLVELGVHRALGARRRRIVLFVLLRAAAVCGAGIAAGVWFGAAIWSILGDLVAGLGPWDRGAVLRFGAVLLASTLLGALPPAWRAARATPASLLAAS
jgi:putative ABC transport system permease protein